MKTRIKALLVTLLVGAAAFALGPVIWPPHPHNPVPTAAQLPFLLVLAVLEALTFGLGVAFVAFGLPLARRLSSNSPARTWTLFGGAAWLMLSWWPHDNLHLHTGMELNGLIIIEYVFHASLMALGVVLAYVFIRAHPVALDERSATERAGAVTTHDPTSQTS